MESPSSTTWLMDKPPLRQPADLEPVNGPTFFARRSSLPLSYAESCREPASFVRTGRHQRDLPFVRPIGHDKAEVVLRGRFVRMGNEQDVLEISRHLPIEHLLPALREGLDHN